MTKRRLKSGLLVLVDLFSLLTMAMFAVFVVSSDAGQIKVPEESATFIEVVVDTEGKAWSAIGELLELRPVILNRDGRVLRQVADGFSMEWFSTPGGLVAVLKGHVAGSIFAVDVARVKSPRAFLTTFKVTINETHPRPRSKSFNSLKAGTWAETMLPLD